MRYPCALWGLAATGCDCQIASTSTLNEKTKRLGAAHKYIVLSGIYAGVLATHQVVANHSSLKLLMLRRMSAEHVSGLFCRNDASNSYANLGSSNNRKQPLLE